MFCILLKCCMNCEKNVDCGLCCGFNDEDKCNKLGIYSVKEFETVYCTDCSFRDCK